jgi:hypothetical protein
LPQIGQLPRSSPSLDDSHKMDLATAVDSAQPRLRASAELVLELVYDGDGLLLASGPSSSSNVGELGAVWCPPGRARARRPANELSRLVRDRADRH